MALEFLNQQVVPWLAVGRGYEYNLGYILVSCSSQSSRIIRRPVNSTLRFDKICRHDSGMYTTAGFCRSSDGSIWPSGNKALVW